MNRRSFGCKLRTSYHQSSQNSYQARHLKGNETLQKEDFLAEICVCMLYSGSCSPVGEKQPCFLYSRNSKSVKNPDLGKCLITHIWSCLCQKMEQQPNVLCYGKGIGVKDNYWWVHTPPLLRGMGLWIWSSRWAIALSPGPAVLPPFRKYTGTVPMVCIFCHLASWL